MDDCSEMLIKKLCCTCLCKDRKLFQLCRLPDGVNNLYSLLSFDSEAYREGFFKDTASLYICWECRAIMCRLSRFRRQACTAQKQLTLISDGRTDIRTNYSCLSRLTAYHTTSCIIHISPNEMTDNFIDCGPTADIKSETEEDIPLSELHNNYITDEELRNGEDLIFQLKEVKFKEKKMKRKKEYFSTVLVDEVELDEIRVSKRLEAGYLEAEFQCESCVQGFGSKAELDKHCQMLHIVKPNHEQCDICLCYVRVETHREHREAHYHKHLCQFCVYTTFSLDDMMDHLASGHVKLTVPVKKKKRQRKSEVLKLKPGTKLRTSAMTDGRTPYGYLCTECNKYFENKNQRWKHVQRHHREGYKCGTCGKRFAFKNDVARHEQLHQGPLPREECPVCHKMIRVDLVKIHSRIHSDRQKFTCVECAKCFVSRASYEHHLKYTQAHAQTDILKYKCTLCDKGYRSRGELRDHVNYQHMGKTQHKCPVCGKALATRRCITRHVRRAHDGVKESARNKICQQCGKAFRDKKGLREHELTHTGERPLSCEICGCTFRQSASLYTHRKRVHKIYPDTKRVTLLEQAT